MASAPPPSDIGTHCTLPSCNALDFLPLVCTHCAHLFCRQHASPTAHACAADPATKGLTAEERLSTAGVQRGPELRELLPDPKRHKREEVALSEEEQAKKAKQAEALEKLMASLAKGKSGGGVPSAPAKKKVNPAVELMKLKQRAKPADPKHVKREGDVPVLERVYLTVRYQEGQEGEEKGMKEVWVAKTITAGKALDLFADLFKANNQNNTTTDPSKLLSLAVPSASTPDSPTRLVLPTLFSSQVTNGGSVLLLKGYPWPSS
ncbi:hypothetical protein JCM6882_002532 [Rhodosporidiobolus microsporus]